MYLGLAFNAEKAVLKYFTENFLSMYARVLELTKTWKTKSEEVEEMEIRREDEMMFTPSIPFLECKVYTKYIPSVGSANQCLREIKPYEVSRRKDSTLFLTNKSVLQVLKNIQSNRDLKRVVTYRLADGNSAIKYAKEARCSEDRYMTACCHGTARSVKRFSQGKSYRLK